MRPTLILRLALLLVAQAISALHPVAAQTRPSNGPVEIKSIQVGSKDQPKSTGATAAPVVLAGADEGEEAEPSKGIDLGSAATAANVPPKTLAAAPKPQAKGTAAAPSSWLPNAVAPKVAVSGHPTERVVFNRRPIKVTLEVGKERMITFPGVIAIHAPEEHESQVAIQTIERTAYVTAHEALTGLRVIAEDLDTGRMIPVDLVASESIKVVTDDLEVYVSRGAEAANDERMAVGTEPAPDMVMLTRHAARALYAPKRLMSVNPAIRPAPVKVAPVPGLYRGYRVQTTPIAAWRSGNLYVTAVRFSNQEKSPVTLDMGDIRGSWLAATPQHGRILEAGNEADTTAVYLVCDRPFEACR